MSLAADDYFAIQNSNSGFRESESHEIDLTEQEPEMVGQMIRFFYVHDYDDGRKATREEGPLMNNTTLYVFDDKYGIPTLKEIVVSKFMDYLSSRNHPSLLKSQSYPESIAFVYDNTVETDRLLKDRMMQAAVDNIRDLMKRKEDGTSSYFREMLRKIRPCWVKSKECLPQDILLLLWDAQ
ncbi:hypothetical protein HYALB_00004243 [Hymenoscyphus albidus]|uniref:BTB domain-containing protein n=1 Tax=Hymenoscyphus albidus TaxID=595503 RepID=A0A9N9Q584_9HELO|nr:hypothetical protein HYALB_00004243 [Hymenoscyphus albidus]